MPASALRIALAQLNPTVGDIAGNAALARQARAEAARAGADLVVLPQLFLSGYPPEGLVAKPAFIRAGRQAAEQLAAETADGGPAMLIGVPWPGEARPHNSMALLHGGEVAALRHKVDLPGHGAFDERSAFAPGPMPGPVNFRDVRIGLVICQDLWGEEVCECLAETGAELLISPNASPFTRGKAEARTGVAVARVTETGLPLIYVNQVGGQDELVFDGASFVLNCGGALAVQMPGWVSAVTVTDWTRAADGWRCAPGPRALLEEGDAAVYRACVLAVRDAANKNDAPGVLVELSGGVGSALCAAMAVDAVGASRVHAVTLPDNESVNEAVAYAEGLGVRHDVLPIQPAMRGLEACVAALFPGEARDLGAAGFRARARGAILAALSNKSGAMIVAAVSKSEAAVGHAILDGNMNGFNPIKDLYKTQVRALARFRNDRRPDGCLGPAGPVIPENIAAIGSNADSLAPEDALDDILQCLVERAMPLSQIVARGHDAETVRVIERQVYLAEVQRRQAAPGVILTDAHPVAGRRYPITNRFREPL